MMAQQIARWDLVSHTPLTHLGLILDCFMPAWHQQVAITGSFRDFKQKNFQKIIQIHQSKHMNVIFTGSFFENVSIPNYIKRMKFKSLVNEKTVENLTSDEFHMQEEKSDIDTMFEVVGKTVGYGDSLRCIETEHTRPGYLRVWYTDNEMAMYCVSKNGRVYLSSTAIMAEYNKLPTMTQTETLEFNGPAVTLINSVTLDNDFVICLKCPTWPNEAEEWITRSRSSGWPPQAFMDEIVTAGCHVVPVAHRQSVWKEAEWRFSFAQAETKLCHSFSLNQRRCYMLLKLVVKNELTPPGLVTSYCLKNLFFRTMEKVPADEWESEVHGFAKVFLYLLDELMFSLIHHTLPHYFISTNNLISHIPKECISELLVAVGRLRRDPIKHLLKFDRINMFQYSPFKGSFSTALEPLTFASSNINGTLMECWEQQYSSLKVLLDMYLDDCQFDGAYAVSEKICHLIYYLGKVDFPPSQYMMQIGFKAQGGRNGKLVCEYLTNRFPESNGIVSVSMAAINMFLKNDLEKSKAQLKKAAQSGIFHSGNSIKFYLILRLCDSTDAAIELLTKVIAEEKELQTTFEFKALDKMFLDDDLCTELDVRNGNMTTYTLMWAFYFLSKFYIDTKQQEKAAELATGLAKACELPKVAKDELAFSLLGYVYKALDQYKLASEAFGKSLDIKQDYELAADNKMVCDTLLLSVLDN